jgi:hypothetical protein
MRALCSLPARPNLRYLKLEAERRCGPASSPRCMRPGGPGVTQNLHYLSH